MLAVEEIEALEKDGYLSLGRLLTKEEVQVVNEGIDELLYQEGKNAGSELFESKYIRHPKEEGADRLANLVNKGSIFDKFYTNSRVLVEITAVLGERFKLSSLNYRAAKPGLGHQKLHVDYEMPLRKVDTRSATLFGCSMTLAKIMGPRALSRVPINRKYYLKMPWKTLTCPTPTKSKLLRLQDPYLLRIKLTNVFEYR